MIRLEQLKLPVLHSPEELEHKITKMLRIPEEELLSCEIRRRSIDARKHPAIYDVYTVDAVVQHEARVLQRVKGKKIYQKENEPPYRYEPSGTRPLASRPVIIGTGPAGLFCGYALARMGYRPLLIERGMDVDSRVRDVKRFWQGGRLMPESNVQFGEGGAGTFSDGKLNTQTHDRCGRNREILRLFAQYGAPEHVLYESKPHIGTDILINVVKNIRKAILSMGGEVRFHTKAADIHTDTDSGRKRLIGLTLLDTESGREEYLETDIAVFAVGHSARDTFSMLCGRGLHMEPKAFAVGVRVEHPQSLIDDAQYGRPHAAGLPAASYKLTAKLSDGRGVYTFCMCPGGYVVNASSEEGRLAVNGMSYSGRDGTNANSAVVVTVTPEDFGGTGALAGVEFQRRLEEHAYRAGNGRIPVQLFGDYKNCAPSEGPGRFWPQMRGAYAWGDVRSIFPEWLAADLEAGILEFGRKLPGYAAEDVVLSAPESRTSSPVRIVRDKDMEGSIRGIYPCGEGAGYAGGITSAATDGLKTAETVSKAYRPFDI